MEIERLGMKIRDVENYDIKTRHLHTLVKKKKPLPGILGAVFTYSGSRDLSTKHALAVVLASCMTAKWLGHFCRNQDTGDLVPSEFAGLFIQAARLASRNSRS